MPLHFSNNSTAEDELRWWRNLCAGQRSALNALFRSYYSVLLNYGLNLISERSLVKDAIQKLFLNLWQQRRSLSEPRSVKSYLLVSLRRIVMDKLQQKQARDQRDRDYMDAVFRDPSNIEQDLIDNEVQAFRRRQLAEAMVNLSPRQKEAIYLRFHDGLTNKEIADVMNIAYQSVRNHISKALKKIRHEMPDSFPLPRP